jgi:hypothetical protein
MVEVGEIMEVVEQFLEQVLLAKIVAMEMKPA